MGRLSADQIAQRAVDLDLLSEREVQEIFAGFGSRTPSPEEFTQAVVSRELMTNYQLDRVVKGERTGFFYGDYKVQYLVGTGTFARVFRAVHRATNQVFAIKVLRKRMSEVPAQYTLFVREGELGCTLRHPNIVPIFEVHSNRNTHFFVMEFVEGRNLREFVKVRGGLEAADAARLMIDIVSGLAYASQRSVTHRDLKMSNVLVSSRGQAKLVDFGLAAMDEALGEELDLPNTRTIDYAALERATGVRKDDARSDVYFAGCIFYHTLTGKPPLSETTDRVQRLSRQRFMEIVPLIQAAPQTPPAIVAVVNKAMSFDPEGRYQSPGEFLADLRRAAARLSEGENGQAKKFDDDQPQQRSVMVVESNERMQDIFREGLKKAGFRVLLSTDPARAVDRARLDGSAPDCMLFNAQEIGEPALLQFNRLADDPATQAIPAALLLDERQREWTRRANIAGPRVVLAMPITLKQLRTELEKLVEAQKG